MRVHVKLVSCNMINNTPAVGALAELLLLRISVSVVVLIYTSYLFLSRSLSVLHCQVPGDEPVLPDM